MKRLKKVFIISAIAIAVIGSVLTSVYTCTLAGKLSELKRSTHTDAVYLRARIRELESELTARVLDRLEQIAAPSSPVGGDAETDLETNRPETETESDPNESETNPDTEEVTLPIHHSPVTLPLPMEPESPSSLYIIAEHNGVIGVFDAEGALLETVNVFVLTLPEEDLEALTVGIPAYSWEEAMEIAGRYE